MKILLVIASLFLTLFAGHTFTQEEIDWLKKHPKVTFAGDPNWLPYEAFKDGEYIGIVAEHLVEIEKSLNIEIEPHETKTWAATLHLAHQKKASIISGDIADTTLNKNYLPIAPYIINPIVIVMDHDTHYVDDLNSISDKKIAIIKDYGYTSDLFKHYPNIKFIEVDNIQEGLNKVNNHDIDALLISNLLARYSLKVMGLAHPRIVGKTSVVMQVTLFVDKELPLLHSAIDKAMHTISIEEHNEIQDTWLHNHKFQKNTNYFILLLLFTILITFIFLYKLFYKTKKQELKVQKFKEMQKIGHLGSWEYCMDTQEITWSDEVFRIFGEEPQSFKPTYEKFLSYIPKPYQLGLQRAVDYAIENETPYEYDHEIIQKDGNSRFIKESGYVRLDEDGNPKTMVGTTLDITSIIDAKSTSAENAKMTNLLSKFDENVMASNTDLVGNIVYASKALSEVSGYSKEELIGSPHSILRHEDNSKELFKELWSTIQNGRIWNGEIKNKKKDGTFFWTKATITPVFGDADVIIGYSSIQHNMTDTKRVEELNRSIQKKSEELMELNKNLEAEILKAVTENEENNHILAQQNKLASMGEMIGNIAHQWRQPINTLGLIFQKLNLSYNKGLLTQKSMEESTKKAMLIIDQMSTTIDDFRNYFAVDKVKVPCEAMDIANQVHSIIATTLNTNHISLNIKCQYNIPMRCLKNELSQVILNIVTNSMDAMLERKIIDGNIDIHISATDKYIQFDIEDNAGGIPKNIMSRIFEPYFTTKEEGKGTGIGLYMSKKIVENNMKGSIDVKNTDKGALLSVKLPK